MSEMSEMCVVCDGMGGWVEGDGWAQMVVKCGECEGVGSVEMVVDVDGEDVSVECVCGEDGVWVVDAWGEYGWWFAGSRIVGANRYEVRCGECVGGEGVWCAPLVKVGNGWGVGKWDGR
jgi:hypothetical protein